MSIRNMSFPDRHFLYLMVCETQFYYRKTIQDKYYFFNQKIRYYENKKYREKPMLSH